MPITRAGLADEIDGFDVQIKALNEAKSAAYKTYREQLEDAGMEPRRASAEVAATKAAIAKRRKLRENPDAAREKDDLIDAILVEIMERPSRAREASYSEAKGRASGERLIDAAREMRGMVGELTNEPEAAAEVAGDYLREPVAAEQGQIIREGGAPRETDRLCGDASCPDAEYSHPQASPRPVDTAGEVHPSSRTSPANKSTDIDLTIPDFLKRTDGYPKRKAVEA